MKEHENRLDELDLTYDEVSEFEPDGFSGADMAPDATQLAALLKRLEHSFDVRIDVDDIDLEDLQTLTRLADVLDERASDGPEQSRDSPITLAPRSGRFRA